MPEIAKLDEDGMLVAVETCHADDHKTCPIARTVALDDGHDMHGRVNNYRWDFARRCFLPLSAEPLDAAERDTPELVEGIVQAIEHLQRHLELDLPKRSQRALHNYRRRNPRRPDPADGPSGSELTGPANKPSGSASQDRGIDNPRARAR